MDIRAGAGSPATIRKYATRMDSAMLFDALNMARRASIRRRSGVVLLRQPSVAAESRGHVALGRFEARRLAPISTRSTLTSSAAAQRSSAKTSLRFLKNGEEPEPAPKGAGACRAHNTVRHTPPRSHTLS
jgi:hypothetical protein